jgi:hypothetical protein
MFRQVISIVLVILLIPTIVLKIVTSSLEKTVANKDFVSSALEKKNFYARTATLVNEKAKEAVSSKGYGEEFFAGVFTEEVIKEKFNKSIEEVYKEEEGDTRFQGRYTDNKEIPNSIRKSVEAMLATSGLTIGQLPSNEKQKVESLITEISGIYDRHMSAMLPELKTYVGYVKEIIYYSRYAGLALIGMIVLLLLISIMKWKELLRICFYSVVFRRYGACNKYKGASNYCKKN